MMKRLLILIGLLLIAAKVDAAEAPFLWKIQGATTQHYLLGSVHLLPESAYPLPPALDKAYTVSRVLVLETDLAETSSFKTQRKWRAAAKAPKGIAAEISPELLQKLRVDGKALNLPVSRCDSYKAWFCAITLELAKLEQAGIEYEQGVDQYYFQRARKDRKTIRWLESPDQQLDLFAGMPDGLSADLLESTLSDLTEPGHGSEDLVRLWQAGDIASFEQLILSAQTQYPDLYDRILVDRNKLWLPQLLKLLEGKEPLLIVVGAAHLVGPTGIPALLKAQGMDVQPATGAAPAGALLGPGELPSATQAR